MKLPKIFIPKGNDPKSVSDFNSEWADRVANLILVGLGVDIIDVFVADRVWYGGLAILANSLIWFGVWGELRFSKLARKADDERVAEAETRLADAIGELARYRAPRRLSIEQQTSITEKLKVFSNVIFDTGWAHPNDEQQSLAWDLEPALTNAGWEQVDWPGWFVSHREPYRPNAGIVAVLDVSIQLHPETERAFKPAALALATALTVEGIAASVDPLNVPGTNKNAMHVMIGTKR